MSLEYEPASQEKYEDAAALLAKVELAAMKRLIASKRRSERPDL